MHPQPMADPVRDDAYWDSTVLDLLLEEHPGVWSIDELRRVAGDSNATDDALARLTALRLVHRGGDCVFATRAAAHMHQLAS